MADEPRTAGWYPDPNGTNKLRWWNGRQWSETYRTAS